MGFRPEETSVERRGAVSGHRGDVRALAHLELLLPLGRHRRDLLAQLHYLGTHPCKLRARRARRRATQGIALVLVPRLRRRRRVGWLPWDRGAVSGVPCDGESPIRRWRRRCRARRAARDRTAASPADRASGTAPAPAPAARAARVARDAARARDDRVSGHAAREPLDCEPLVRLARDPQLRTQRIELRS